MRKFTMISICFCASFIPMPQPHASEYNTKTMTIKQAYQALPHQQTTFDKKTSNIASADSRYLEHLFFVTDIAFRERMIMLGSFYNGDDQRYIEKYQTQMNDLIASFTLTSPPTRDLKKVERLIIESLREQQSFFVKWNKMRGSAEYYALQKNYARHPLVQSSHKKLLQSYGVLKQSYKKETPHNQQAFFDHLCALDFL